MIDKDTRMNGSVSNNRCYGGLGAIGDELFGKAPVH